MPNIIDFMGPAEDKIQSLVVTRDSGVVPAPELLASVRAKYLLSLRERLQKDETIKAVVTASVPATDAFAFVEGAAWELVREGTEDVYRDAIMFLLAELDELRKGADQAYVVDTSTGEIVAPLTKEAIYQPPDYVDEQGITRPAKPVLDPQLAAFLIMKSAADAREAEVRRKAEDPVRGRAYLHLTRPQMIAELAEQRLAESGMRRVKDEADLKDCELTLLEFGQEANEADLQSTNPFYHRLWSYSAILASRVMMMAGTGGEYWMSEVHGNRDEEVRWYAVTVRVRRRMM
jgi:hypothetical protein